MKIRLYKSKSTCNGNGHKSIILDIRFGKKKKQIILFRKILGNGDDGIRCESKLL